MRQIGMSIHTPVSFKGRRFLRALVTLVIASVISVNWSSVAVAVADPGILPPLYCAFDDEPRTAVVSVEGLVVLNGTKATAHQFQSADVGQPKPEYRFVDGPTLIVNEPDQPGNRAAFLEQSLGACVRAPRGFVPRRVRSAGALSQRASTKSPTSGTLSGQQIVFVGAVKKGWREVFAPTPRAGGFGLVVSRGWVKAGAVASGPLATF
jgi:hypothetical protein